MLFSIMNVDLLLVCISVFLDKVFPLIFRLAALGSILFTPVLLYWGNSVGAIVAVSIDHVYFCLCSVAVFGAHRHAQDFIGVQYSGFYCHRHRFDGVFQMSPPDILAAVGKTRHYGPHPLCGTRVDFIHPKHCSRRGYRTFWRISNPTYRIMGLWRRTEWRGI